MRQHGAEVLNSPNGNSVKKICLTIYVYYIDCSMKHALHRQNTRKIGENENENEFKQSKT